MFDGNADSTGSADANVARLCALYDGLLEAPDATVSAEAETELKALAKIFDLDAERPAAGGWRLSTLTPARARCRPRWRGRRSPSASSRPGCGAPSR